jgi:Tol biopolymer transport system component
MLLSSGARLGPYEIVTPLAAGGMGEVYRARDTRLDRTVAIKVLAPSLAADPQFRARFDREARTISHLDHPHICTLHDIGEQDGVAYLVMQYLEGETLAARLARSPLSFEQALTIAIEIVSALDKAHRAGVIHRDLKPGNVMLTPTGAKLLDFGIAKSPAATIAATGVSMLPTTPASLTAQGAIVGTLQYMAPEQLEGKEVDARTDIFAFGAVAHEMFTGKKAFEGKSSAGLIAAILEHAPAPVSSVQQQASPALDRLVRTCLDKNPDNRWQSAADLLRELKWIAATLSSTERVVVRPGHRWGWLGSAATGWGVAAVCALVAITLALMLWTRAPASSLPSSSVRLSVSLPDGALLVTEAFPALALSPLGTHLVYAAQRDAGPRLYLRRLDTFETKELPGTEGATSPFFSPDGQWIGFAAQGKLKKVSIAGGQPFVIADSPVLFGGTWGPDDTIVFAATDVGLSRVSSSGGLVTPASALDGEAGEGGHLWPEFLPDGKSILLTVGTTGTNMDRARIVIQPLDGGPRRTLVQGGTNPHYVPSGHIVYSSAGTLMAVPFDVATGTVTGAGVPVLDGVAQTPIGAAHFTASAAGSLAFVPGDVRTPTRTLRWLDRSGRETPLPLPHRAYWSPRLSPDGRRIAVGIEGATHDVWVSDVARDTLTRLTFGSDNYLPVWTPDGTRIAFQSNRNGPWRIFWAPVDRSSSEEQLVGGDNTPVPSSFSSDGEALAYFSMSTKTSADLWLIPLKGERTPKSFLQTPAMELSPAISPTGGWIAYQSNESGRDEVYVRRYPDGGRLQQITTGGGMYPAWSRDGRELFYWTGDALGVVAVESGAEFRHSNPRELFKTSFAVVAPTAPYDVAPDGRRFVFVRDEGRQPGPAQFNFVQGWLQELTTRVPAK